MQTRNVKFAAFQTRDVFYWSRGRYNHDEMDRLAR
jgi:hypothetical protein